MIAGSNLAEGMGVGLLCLSRVGKVAATSTCWSLVQGSPTGYIIIIIIIIIIITIIRPVTRDVRIE
jgi:hypothetical protein